MSRLTDKTAAIAAPRYVCGFSCGAAPDLLAALEDMVETIEIGEGPGAFKDSWPNASKAISKARNG